MIAKVCRNTARIGGRGVEGGWPFGARVAYVSRKAGAVRCVNLCGGWQDARAQMQMTRGLNSAVQHPYDLRYVLHRTGVRIAHRASAWRMAASQLGTACGLWAMQNRIGAFAPDLGTGGATTAFPDPAAPAHGHAESALLTFTTKLLHPILAERQKHQNVRLEARQAQQQLSQAQAAETAAVRQILQGSKNPMAQALRLVMHQQHKTERQLRGKV